MNPQELYRLTPEQAARYSSSPQFSFPLFYGYSDSQQPKTAKADKPLQFLYSTSTATFEPHWHTALEIVMPLRSHYTLIAKEYVELAPGDIMVIPAGCVHSVDNVTAEPRLVLLIEQDTIAKLPSGSNILGLLTDPLRISYDSDPEMYRECSAMVLEMASHYWGDMITKELHIFSCLLRFFASIAEHSLSATISTPKEPARADALMARLSVVLNYIDNHYYENITLEDAAAIVCFSKYYFTRLFKQCTNQTFNDYLNNKRIKAAQQLLLVPNLSITDISLKTGFSSLSSFNRTFKRIRGCSPSEYRALYASNDRSALIFPGDPLHTFEI